MSIEVNDSNFEQEVLKSEKPVLVDFWAQWCGPCKMLSPVIDEIAEDNSQNLKVCKVNVDESRSSASNYGIMSIPTLVLFRDGKEIERIVGALPKEKIEEKISAHV
ncbi:MAG: thioredoxin [Elusimicrobiota bacterium]